MQTKRCCLCGKEKPATSEYFVMNVRKLRTEGMTSERLDSRCKPCLNAYHKVHNAKYRAARKANPENFARRGVTIPTRKEMTDWYNRGCPLT